MEHQIPKSKTRDLVAIWTEFNQLAVKHSGQNFCHGVPGLAPPQFLLDELIEVIKVNMNNQYAPVAGHLELRNAIAKWWKPHFNGREINPLKEVLVTNGAIGAIYSIINNMVGKGDFVHMFEPYYTQYINIIEFAGAESRTSPMSTNEKGEWAFDFDHFENSLDENSKLVILNNPHNPSGRVFTAEEMDRLSAILEKWPQVTVLNDEVYFHLPFDGRKITSFANLSQANWDKSVNVYSAGKMLNCTGWKIGWCIGPDRLIAQAFYSHEATTFTNNVPGQVAIARAMEKMWTMEYEGYANYFVYTQAVFMQGRDACIELLKKATGIKFTPTVIESGYFMPVDVTGCEDKIPAKYFIKNVNYEDDANTNVKQMMFPDNFEKVPLDFAMCRFLACEHGISCMPVTNFCLHESKHALHNYIRIAICRPETQFNNELMQKKFEAL